ncbi:MAG TPA: DUF5615 family PIN-like protein [Dehalococcoidia bacterium]|nr:DUF5615 family PIN-like protein [Dehalococcoidia bacterium]
MASFLLDHNVDQALSRLLVRASHTAATARLVGLARAGDDELLLRAATHGQTLVTHNIRDFELLHDAWRRWTGAWNVHRQHAGILILPQPLTAETSAGLLASFLALNLPIENELYRWRTATGWQRRG